MNDISIHSGLAIPERELRFVFTASPGPGGQNVNRVNTRAELRFDVRRSPSLDEVQRSRLLRALGSRVSREGILAIRSSRFRSQGRNRADCIDRFVREIAEALRPPPKPRKRTRPGPASQARRIQQKRNQSLKKALRRRPPTA